MAILPTVLQRLGVPTNTYSIGDRAEMRWCLIVEQGAWSVFFQERGSRFDLATFAKEEDACYHLLGRMAMQQVLDDTVPPVGN